MNQSTTPAVPTVQADAATPQPTVASRASILMVDDQPARLFSYEAVLSGLDVECVRALSGREALKQLLSKEFAAILLDVNMPEMDGFETARMIREHPRMERIPIIFITGIHVTEFDQLKGYEVGAIDYIAVPVVPDILRSKVAVLVELHQRRSALAALNKALSEARAELEAQHAKALAERDAGLRRSEGRHRALLENAPVAVAHNALDGRFEYVNRAFCKMVGYSPEELLTKRWQDLTHPEDVAHELQLADQVIAGTLADYTIQKRYLHKQGHSVWVNLFGNFVAEDGHAVQGVAVAIDISEQRSATTALMHSREQLILAKAAAYLGIHDWDIRNNSISWDERTREIWGAGPGEPVTFESFVAGLHPDDLATTQAAVNRALDPSGDGHYLATYRVINAVRGETYWVEATGRTFFEDGTPVRLVGTVQDVTQRVNAQLALKEANVRKDEFLAMLSHELRNPAAAIGNAAQALSRLVATRDSEQSLVGVIERQTQHLGRLLDDLLDVARITRGRIDIQRETVTLQSCLDLALETAQPIIQERRHRLTTSQWFEPLWLSADKVRLSQCIVNLLTNAARYTEPGGEIFIRMLIEATEAVVEVRDTGVGIAPEFLPRIFELFAQSERSLDRSQGGLGIGLAVCRKLVEMQGGRIDVTSPGIGHGSTFTIRLPLATAPASSQPAETTTGISHTRVLIVDDNIDAADSLELLLRLDGHATMTAYSARDALERAVTFAPEFVLLDIGLPEMDGYEVARRLKALLPQVRLIAVTGYGLAEDQLRAANAGFDAHMVKPVRITDIEAALVLPRRSM